MLILTRKINQAIIINDSVTVKVLEIRGDQVKLGVDAPKSIKIFRAEIHEEIQKQNIEAAKSSIDSKDLDNLLS